jgi:hypothetical protein
MRSPATAFLAPPATSPGEQACDRELLFAQGQAIWGAEQKAWFTRPGRQRLVATLPGYPAERL